MTDEEYNALHKVLDDPSISTPTFRDAYDKWAPEAMMRGDLNDENAYYHRLRGMRIIHPLHAITAPNEAATELQHRLRDYYGENSILSEMRPTIVGMSKEQFSRWLAANYELDLLCDMDKLRLANAFAALLKSEGRYIDPNDNFDPQLLVALGRLEAAGKIKLVDRKAEARARRFRYSKWKGR